MADHRYLYFAAVTLGGLVWVSGAGAQQPPVQQTTQTTQTTTTMGAPQDAPLTKKQMKEQRKLQKQQEKSASESAKAQKDQANALKHQDKATDAGEKSTPVGGAPPAEPVRPVTPPPQ